MTRIFKQTPGRLIVEIWYFLLLMYAFHKRSSESLYVLLVIASENQCRGRGGMAGSMTRTFSQSESQNLVITQKRDNVDHKDENKLRSLVSFCPGLCPGYQTLEKKTRVWVSVPSLDLRSGPNKQVSAAHGKDLLPMKLRRFN